MAKEKKTVGGPFVAAAFLCGGVTEDSNGVLSAHSIVDEIRVAVSPEADAEFPSKANPVQLSLFALVMIRRGDGPSGKRKLRLVLESPIGKSKELFKTALEMPQHPNGAATVKVRMAMKLYHPGVSWIDVILDGERLTRMPLNLVIQRDQKAEKPTAKKVAQ